MSKKAKKHRKGCAKIRKCFGFLIFFIYSFGWSQNIQVFFNQSVDTTVSPVVNAQTSSGLEDTLCSIIHSANVTLDVAVWDNGSVKIVDALNDAYDRGVRIRYISSTNSLNTALSGLNSSIPVLKRSASLNSHVMHNKFLVVDGHKLMTGSMNFGMGSMQDDYNNLVFVKDSSLSQAYTLEFEEMWGGSGDFPNLGTSKFGPDKTDNTPHLFSVGSTQIESFFSPTDQTTQHIVDAINSADFSLDIAMFTFIHDAISQAVVAAKNRGVFVRCILENVNYFGSEYNTLLSNGIQVLSHENVPFDFHHKYCIIDGQNPGSDPLVVTGSHNWTHSAEEDYDENTLILHDYLVANQYWEEFSRRFDELISAARTNTLPPYLYQIFPNPSGETIRIHSASQFQDANITVFLPSGQEVRKVVGLFGNEYVLERGGLPEGMYFIQVQENNQIRLTEKVIWQGQ